MATKLVSAEPVNVNNEPVWINIDAVWTPKALMEPRVVPLVAFTSPVIATDVAVNAPALVTLNGAELKVLSPKWIPADVSNETLVVPLPAIKDVGPKVKPPIVPSFAVTLPDITIPSADADNTVTLLDVFISMESLSIFICSPLVSPSNTSLPKKDDVALPLTIVSPSSLTSAYVLERLALPKNLALVLNLDIVPPCSFCTSTPVELILTWVAIDWEDSNKVWSCDAESAG